MHMQELATDLRPLGFNVLKFDVCSRRNTRKLPDKSRRILSLVAALYARSVFI